MEQIILPVQNQGGYYEMRLESIGGLGANLCGKMLGELGIRHLGLNSASFSSYGSEKTGTPVKAYIRYCAPEKEIRVHSPVTHPHLLGIFHDALLQNDGILEGCTKDTVIVLNTQQEADEILKKCTQTAELYLVPAQRIAIETHSRTNVVMLGALGAAMGFVPLAALKQVCEDNLGRKYPDALAANLAGIERGYQEVKHVHVNHMHIEETKQDCTGHAQKEQEWGYETAPIGGINPHIGNSVISDLSPSRQGYIPIFRPEKCINCALCDSTCPDMVFQFKKGIYKGKEMMVNKGLDYYHCKGCLRCVASCPTGALIRGTEAEHPQKNFFLLNQDLLRQPKYYEESGADGYITSESYLTEKRMEGGEV